MLQNMREYKFSLTRNFPYNGRIYDSAPIRENTVQRKPALFTHILRSGDNHSDEKKEFIYYKSMQHLPQFLVHRLTT